MYPFLVRNDRGAVTADWVALTAGIVALGMVVLYSVMGDSHVYVEDTFEDLNRDLNENSVALRALERSVDLNPAPITTGQSVRPTP